MRLYNTLTRTEEPVAPGIDHTVRMYTCGLTVYARGHIGNFRTFICVDVLRRTLKYLLGKNPAGDESPTWTIAPSSAHRRPGWTCAATPIVHRDVGEAPSPSASGGRETPRATDPPNLQAMADLIRALDKNVHTVSDSSIYSISTLPGYGKLAHLDRRHAAGCAGRHRHLRKRRCAGLRAVEATKPDRPRALVDPPDVGLAP